MTVDKIWKWGRSPAADGYSDRLERVFTLVSAPQGAPAAKGRHVLGRRAAADGETVIHRNLTPDTVRVRADGAPLFAGWRWARLPFAETITPGPIHEVYDEFTAPEVCSQGLTAAVVASDVYSLCKSLLAVATDGGPATEALRIALAFGLDEDPSRRGAPTEVAELIESWTSVKELATSATAPAAKRWDEGYTFDWENHQYRVVSLLGHGGAGRTFKLEQLDRETDDPIGTYVGKVVFNSELGPSSLRAYRKIRSIADHPSLASVLHTSAEWSADTLIALLRWRRGEPLDAWKGEALSVLADYTGESDVETMILRWAGELCEALEVLHAQGWVHGDVSPSNILVDEGELLLIDYDLAGPAGSIAATPGTFLYASPERRHNAPMRPADDVFALAATLFHSATGRQPFAGPGQLSVLTWTDGERTRWPRLVKFLDAATHPEASRRFESGGSAARMLRADVTDTVSERSIISEPAPLTPNIVSRVRDILQTYPGSRFGNIETRGLDSKFAHDTYVDTGLDVRLPRAIEAGELSLVILCGNAGDGKTAFLQHLASSFGAPHLSSSDRVWNGTIQGCAIKINLDGAAAWRDRSADDLLDEIFAPFHDGPPKDRRAHLVAVNDGRLMEWIESYEARHGTTTRLTEQLTDALGPDVSSLDAHIELIELNLRSLVGGISLGEGHVTNEFLDSLISKLVGGKEAPEIWKPCRTCTACARCSMRRSADMLGASANPAVLARGVLFRRRLASALQAVHQRNEVHITARELKAAISYILFGLYSCEDLHANPDLSPHAPSDYVFDPDSPLRQGELLQELTRLDPGLEAHPRIDRYIAGHGVPGIDHGAPRYPDLPLRQARRRAWFDWTDTQIEAVGSEPAALGLRGGRRFAEFRDFPLLNELEQRRIRQALCRGLSRLESLPDIAFSVPSMAPIRIVPRTPTETAFWVGKPLNRFALEPERFNAPKGLETLHRHLVLSYHALDGRTEQLTISLELFSLLMDLAGGAQILDAFSDDVFANLGVFTQRLAQEDERSLHAWNPADESKVYNIAIKDIEGYQSMVLKGEEAG
jgi:serine/threonine protein kinase